MTFHLENTLIGYARAAVHLKTRMADASTTTATQNYLRELIGAGSDLDAVDVDVTRVAEVVGRATSASWSLGEAFVLAPAMTAIIAAAASALDLTGDLLTADAAPCDAGVLFLPEPIHHRWRDGTLSAVGAITWIPITSSTSRSWVIRAWAPLDDPDDPRAVAMLEQLRAAPRLRNALGPYVLSDYGMLPIAEPVPTHPSRPVDDAVTD